MFVTGLVDEGWLTVVESLWSEDVLLFVEIGREKFFWYYGDKVVVEQKGNMVS